MCISPTTLVATIVSQLPSMLACATSVPSASPALLTRTSTSRHPSGKLPGKARTAASSVTSNVNGSTAAPSSLRQRLQPLMPPRRRNHPVPIGHHAPGTIADTKPSARAGHQNSQRHPAILPNAPGS